MLFNRMNNLSVIVALLSMGLITSCGYTMRGSLNLPASLSDISVYSSKYSVLVNSINETLINSGINVTNSNDKTLHRIVILSERFNRRQLSMSISGRVNEYELIYDVQYEINQKSQM